MTRPGGAPALHQQLEYTARLLMAVRGGASLPDALQQVPAPIRAGCQALGFHVMRWRGSAEAARDTLVTRKPAAEVDALLTCALALMWPADAPPYTAHVLVDEAVKCASRLAPHSKGFVNAVLRNALRQGQNLRQAVAQSLQGRHNHPAWWVQRLQRDWPAHAADILQAAQAHPPMTLRAHARHGGLPALGPALDAAGVAWGTVKLPHAALTSPGPAPALPQCAVLTRALPVDQIPGFAQGHWSVQDAAAQLAAPLLLQGLERAGHADGRRPRVLDACAAPGGKTAHLLELAELDLWALDADAQRLVRVGDNLRRLSLPWPTGGATAVLKAADARAVASWWDGQPFDAVLLDAPCSASGIVRRHPDARWLRRDSDIAALARLQAELLDALWPLVRPGGCLLYATCSVFKDEGIHQIDAFLQRQGLPSRILDPASPGHLLPLVDNPSSGVERTPGRPDPACDGFFYALLHKP
ncbi:MAG: 16S rRNA (cytosine(967)-C(5))-methyltransferase RsmB [Betaproteobacteria bacterium]|nr:16S rRNA (cytosine(967)-C(5))-methyltransferase RsmB [Betaproteobacteria bacterium]